MHDQYINMYKLNHEDIQLGHCGPGLAITNPMAIRRPLKLSKPQFIYNMEIMIPALPSSKDSVRLK